MSDRLWSAVDQHLEREADARQLAWVRLVVALAAVLVALVVSSV